MDKLEQKILRDMEVEGKIIAVAMVVLLVAFIFSVGYMAA